MATVNISDEKLTIVLVDESDLELIGRAARVATRAATQLEIVVFYAPPPIGTLAKWRQSAPEELRSYIHGSTRADRIARLALAKARAEGAQAVVRCEQTAA